MNIRVLNTEKFNRILEPTSFLIKIHKKVYKIDIVRLYLKGTFSLYLCLKKRKFKFDFTVNFHIHCSCYENIEDNSAKC